MPPTLRQATGNGSSVWTISDTNGTVTQYESALVLDNQGQIFVNGGANLASGTSNINWVVTGSTSATAGNQYFENDGSVNIVGATAGSHASVSATFVTGGTSTQNLSVTGNGAFNLYGNAALVFGSGVGVSAGQTVNFITDSNGVTGGQVTEVSALDDAAVFSGFETGDTVTLENLTNTATAPDRDRHARQRRSDGEHTSKAAHWSTR